MLTPLAAHEESEVIWERERQFHDALAGDLDVDALECPELLGPLDAAMLELAGDVHGRSILDAGCGQGDMTLRLLEQGAAVTALDVSPGMVDVVRRRVLRRARASDSFAAVVAPLELSGLPDASFDLILGKFVLHHVDVAAAGPELKRLLRPGGRAIFAENAGDNPLLAFARRHIAGRLGIARYGTDDEHPLVKSDLDALRSVFARVIAHYPVFECCVLFDRQVLRFRYRRASRVIRKVDNAIYRYAPPLRRFSYRIVVEIRV